MLSVASRRAANRAPGHAASKAARWSLTNAFRVALGTRATLVVGVHVGYVGTDATVTIDAPKVEVVEVAAKTMDAISHDEPAMLVGETARPGARRAVGPLELLRPAP